MQAVLPASGALAGGEQGDGNSMAALPAPPSSDSAAAGEQAPLCAFTWPFVLRQPVPGLGPGRLGEGGRPTATHTVTVQLLAPSGGTVHCGRPLTFLWQLRRTAASSAQHAGLCTGGGGGEEGSTGPLGGQQHDLGSGLVRGAQEYEVLSYRVGPGDGLNRLSVDMGSKGWAGRLQAGTAGLERETAWPWVPAGGCGGGVRLGWGKGAVALVEVVLTPVQVGWMALPQLAVQPRLGTAKSVAGLGGDRVFVLE